MKRHQAAKYRKARKLESSNRKAKNEQTRKVKREQHLKQQMELLRVDKVPVLDDGELGEPAPGAIEKIVEAVKPASPARRAFQDA